MKDNFKNTDQEHKNPTSQIPNEWVTSKAEQEDVWNQMAQKFAGYKKQKKEANN